MMQTETESLRISVAQAAVQQQQQQGQIMAQLAERDTQFAFLTQQAVRTNALLESLLAPKSNPTELLAHGPAPAGDGRTAWFVVCPAPPGPPLWPAGATEQPPWSEAALIHELGRRGIRGRALRLIGYGEEA